MFPSLASSWQETREKTSSSKIICKYLIWLCNSLSFCFIPLPPFSFQTELLILTFTHKGQLSPTLLVSTRTNGEKFTGRCCKAKAKAHHHSWVESDECHIEWHEIRGELLQKVCPAVVVGGCGYLPCTKTLIYLYICVMVSPEELEAETKHCTKHVSGVHESHFYFSTKKCVIFPRGQLDYISVKDCLAPEQILISHSLTKCQFVLFFSGVISFDWGKHFTSFRLQKSWHIISFFSSVICQKNLIFFPL